jgi:hypothetical protein
VIVALHVATGAVAGALSGSRGRALLVGVALHALGDAIPHEDTNDRDFEIATGLALIGAIAAARGPLSPAVFGAAAASAPDLEHVLPFPRPGGRPLFPSHRLRGWHRGGGIPASLQLAAAGAVVAFLVARELGREDERGGDPRSEQTDGRPLV